MSEKLTQGVEHQKSAEQAADLERLAAEKLQDRRERVEKAENRTEQAEKAREAIAKVETPRPAAEKEYTPQHRSLSGLDRRLNFRQTMVSMQSRLGPVSRSFSKFIHNPVVERTSDAVGKTIARPSAALGATTTALVVGLILYFTARFYGFSLRGPELVLAFVVGGIIGLLVEAIYKTLRRLRHWH
jgi:hypothetical protein